MNRQISWVDISTKLSKLMDKHQTIKINSLDDVMAIDHLARHEADNI
jgi:1-deoxy-D-xylulose 5-phosphate reductoisomerase